MARVFIVFERTDYKENMRAQSIDFRGTGAPGSSLAEYDIGNVACCSAVDANVHSVILQSLSKFKPADMGPVKVPDDRYGA